MRSVCSGSAMRADSRALSGESNRHNSTFSACSEKIAKLTPEPSQVAPRGYGEPGRTFMPAPWRQGRAVRSAQLPSRLRSEKGRDDPNTGRQNAEAGLPSLLAVAVATTTDEPCDIDLKYDTNRFG